MPAVVRVKRRIDEEPLSAFVLNGKKRRLDDDASASVAEATINSLGSSDDVLVSNAIGASAISSNKDEISTILKFAGTMRSQDDITQLARLTKDEAKELVQQKSRKPTNLTERARQEMRQSLHENRFRVVNCLRTTLEAEEVSEEPKELTIVDIEKQHAISDNSLQSTSNIQSDNTQAATTAASNNVITDVTAANFPQPSDSDTGYVYDLYLPENEQQSEYVDLMDDNYLSIRPFDDLIYEDRFNNDDDENDSEDSNQENYFGNDYPDEDDDRAMYSDQNDDESNDDEDFEGARELHRAVEKFVLCDDDEDEEDAEYFEESSDDEDCVEYSDPYIQTVDYSDEDGFLDDIDNSIADRYGMAYARYKARVLKRLQGTPNKDDDDDDDDEISNKDVEHYHSASED